jgi:hypothetical protein
MDARSTVVTATLNTARAQSAIGPGNDNQPMLFIGHFPNRNKLVSTSEA